MINEPRKNSLFWPIILIGAGLILLLRNLGVLESFNFNVLLRLWPLILVVIGLDLIFGRRYPWAGALIALLAVGGVIAFLYFAPNLGINPPAGVKTEVLTTPVESTTRVQYNLDTSYEPVSIKALPASSDLFKATIVHNGQLNFNVTGDTDKTVSLSETTDPENWFSLDLGLSGLKWDIGLNPSVPAVLNLDGGSGSLDINLTGLKLESFDASLGSGASTITLPVSTAAYTVEIDSGSGAVNVKMPATTPLTLTLSSGSGAVTMRVPAGTALKVEVMDDGSGAVRLPGSLQLMDGDGSFEDDTWQSTGFDTAANPIVILIEDRGSGSITITN